MGEVITAPGWCGTPWPGETSWSYVGRVDNAIAHQFDVQLTKIVGHQSNIQIDDDFPVGHQALVHIQDETAETGHQFTVRYDAVNPAIGHQFLLTAVGCDGGGWCSAPWPGYSSWAFVPNCRYAYGHQVDIQRSQVIGHEVTLDLPAREPVYHQVNLRIDTTNDIWHQYNAEIDSHIAGVDKVTGHQFNAEIEGITKLYHQFTTRIDKEDPIFHQFLAIIDSHVAGVDDVTYHQVNIEVGTEEVYHHQYTQQVNKIRRQWHQFRIQIDAVPEWYHQYLYNSPYFFVCGNWCGAPWPGTTPWAFTCQLNKLTAHQFNIVVDTGVSNTSPINYHQFTIAPLASQRVKHQINFQTLNQFTLKNQFTYVVAPEVYGGTQFFGHQFSIQTTKLINHQWRIKVYNTDNLRILWEFSSDGTQYNNVSASSNAGQDFLAINLKSDIVEQKWRSGGVLEEWIQVDCGVGLTRLFDTVALISTNLSPGAIIRLYGYGGAYEAAPASDAIWYALTPVAVIATPNANDNTEDIIWIAPEQPTQSYRHWRIRINDENNADGYLEVGRFVAGESMIFVNENYTMDVEFSDLNFKDEVQLNGFSSIANNRALKRKLRLTFENLNVNSLQNYKNIKSYLRYCRDTLKALVIPDPQNPYLYTVFSKVSQMPQQTHRYVAADSHYSSMSIEWDESK